MHGEHKVAIAGAGTIGVGWAIAFARAGIPVRVFDPDTARLVAAREEIDGRLRMLDEHGLLRQVVEDVSGRISYFADLAEAVAEASLVEECAPERLELKRSLFEELATVAPARAIVASSTSAISPGELFAGLPNADRCLVTHPTNPPYLLPVVELVRSAATSDETADRAARLFELAGMEPIRVNGEAEGFVVNRLQGALLREAYCLLRDGVATVDEIDLAVRGGLGRRWAITGPFETADLNTRGGIESHAAKLGPAYARMGAERGQDDPWTDDLVARATAGRRELLSLDDWADRVEWRDRRLMQMQKGQEDD